MLTYNYPDGVDKIQLSSGSNYAYSITNNMLLNGFLFRQIFVVVLFTWKNFAATVFTVAKSKSYQTNNQSTGNPYNFNFSPHSDICVRILLLVWEPV